MLPIRRSKNFHFGSKLPPTDGKGGTDSFVKYFTFLFGFILLPSSFCLGATEGALIRLQYNNPGLIVDLGVGLWAWPMPMDWDQDGDLDVWRHVVQW